MREVGQGPPCSLLEAGPWSTLHPQHCIQLIFQREGHASGGPWPTLDPQHCIQVIFQSEGNASGGPWPTLQPAGGRSLAHPACATPQSTYFHCIQVIFQSEGNASGGPGPSSRALQQAAGRALAHPASATLHTSTISERGQCEWWARARPLACWRAGPGPLFIRKTAHCIQVIFQI
jgi:hypothetical protein